MEAGSRGGFLAVSSLWSFCRCKGLYVILGKTKEEREKCANLLSIAEQHSFVIQVCLEENGSSCYLEVGKSAKEREGKKKDWHKQGVCLKDNQFVFDKFLLFKIQGPVSQALRLFPSWFVKSSSRRNFAWVRVCAAVCSERFPRALSDCSERPWFTIHVTALTAM